MECEHCFVYSRPDSPGTFTIEQVRAVLEQLKGIPTIKSVYFEGGEPFLYYPLMLEGIRLARDMGFRTGVVTNAYWANSETDAELWLRPLKDLGVSDVSISPDRLHYNSEDDPEDCVISAASRLGLKVNSICVELPGNRETMREKGEAIVSGNVVIRGRAVDRLTEDLPTRPNSEFDECKDEDLRDPGRVHVDPYGNVHICQGLVIGNLWETPLKKIMEIYDPDAHPMCGPLLEGGPARLVDRYGPHLKGDHCSACHLCYEARRTLIDRFPDVLAPRQVYGLE